MEAETFNQRLGRNLVTLREAKQMSQQELADAMRLRGFRWAQSTVWNIERGERPLKFEEAVALGSVFDVTVDALAGPDDLVLSELDFALKQGAVIRAAEDLKEAAEEYERATKAVAPYLQDKSAPGLDRGKMLFYVSRSCAEIAMEGFDRSRDWRHDYGFGLDEHDPAQVLDAGDGQH